MDHITRSRIKFNDARGCLTMVLHKNATRICTCAHFWPGFPRATGELGSKVQLSAFADCCICL